MWVGRQRNPSPSLCHLQKRQHRYSPLRRKVWTTATLYRRRHRKRPTTNILGRRAAKQFMLRPSRKKRSKQNTNKSSHLLHYRSDKFCKTSPNKLSLCRCTEHILRRYILYRLPNTPKRKRRSPPPATGSKPKNLTCLLWPLLRRPCERQSTIPNKALNNMSTRSIQQNRSRLGTTTGEQLCL